MKEVEARLKISAVDKTGQVFKALSGKLHEIEKKAEGLNRQQSALARTSEGVALALGRFVGPAAVGAGLVYATKQAANFEESLGNIAKKSSASADQMAKIRSEVMLLGHEMPSSLDEIAKGFERGAAAGIPLDQLKDFAKLSVMVADAWDTTAENSANFFSGFHASMGLQFGDEMKAYASLINDLADSGISDETGIADFIDRAGASMKNFGLTPQEIAGYGAAMLNLKMPADVAARAMDTLTSKLIAPENLSPKATTALTKIVGDLDKFKKMSGDQKLTFFLGQLEKMTGQQRTSLLGGLLGEGFDDEVARLVNGMDEVRRNLALAHQETAQASNSVDRVYAQRMALFNSQLALLQNNMNELAVRIGSYALPWVNAGATSVNQFMSDADAWEAANKGKSWEEKHNQRLEYEKRWNALHPAKGVRDYLTMNARRAGDFGRDLASVGRGDAKTVFDQLERQEMFAAWPDRGPRLWPDQPPVDHGYSIRNLPLIGPVPASRPSLDSAADHIEESGKKAGDAIDQAGASVAGQLSQNGGKIASVLAFIAASLHGVSVNGPPSSNLPAIGNVDRGRTMPPQVTGGGKGGGGGSGW